MQGLHCDGAGRSGRVLQNVVKFRGRFSGYRHFSVDAAERGLTFRSDLLDPSVRAESRSARGSHGVAGALVLIGARAET